MPEPVDTHSDNHTVISVPSIGSTLIHVVALGIVMLLLLAASPLLVLGTVQVFHVLNPDLAVLLLVAAITYGILWAVGASLDKKYQSIAATSFSDASSRPSVPRNLTRAYGMLLICLLPFLFYLFVFALYLVELFITLSLLLGDKMEGMPVVVLVGLLIVAAGSVWGVAVGFWRLLVPAKTPEFGVGLSREENRRLWDLVDEVARDAGTRSVDRLWLAPDAGISVWEDAALIRILTGRGKRCMRIGLTAVHDMTERELKSILRHEFAHFGNRDTAWGSFTYSMSRSLMAAWRATPGGNPLKQGSIMGGVISLNPAWWVYWLYVRLFFRATNGFSRLREIVADWDAIAYSGGECFASGLSKVILNDHALFVWLRETKMVDGEVPNVAGGVSAALSSMTANERGETLKSALVAPPAKTRAYDTHPEPEIRLEYARRAPGVTGACPESPVRDLLDDWESADARVSRAWLAPAAAATQ